MLQSAASIGTINGCIPTTAEWPHRKPSRYNNTRFTFFSFIYMSSLFALSVRHYTETERKKKAKAENSYHFSLTLFYISFLILCLFFRANHYFVRIYQPKLISCNILNVFLRLHIVFFFFQFLMLVLCIFNLGSNLCCLYLQLCFLLP